MSQVPGERPGGLEEPVLPPDARGAGSGDTTMFDFDRDPDTGGDTPTASELLAEAGLDPRAIRELLAGFGSQGE